MVRVFCAGVILLALSTQVAEAGRRGRCHCNYAPPACAEAAPAAQAADSAADQAQRPEATRSFSYEPAMQPAAGTTSSGFYAGTLSRDPRIIGTYGHRPASDKALGRY